MLGISTVLWAAGLLSLAAAPATDLSSAVNAFLNGLDETQRARTVFAFDSDQRWDWHFVPRERAGVALKELTPAQQALALAVLKAGLSEHGVTTVETIRSLEGVLRQIEGPQATHRDPLDYHFQVFGTPAAEGTWALRYEGHHCSLQWTIVQGTAMSTTPQFMGSNPGDVLEGDLAGTRALGDLEDLGRAFIMSLDDAQRATAILSDAAPKDILTGAEHEAPMQEDRGIPYTALSEPQKAAFIGLIEAYARYQRPEIAEQRLARIQKAGLDDIKFAWMGSLEKGQGHYYRIQGRTFILEYDNTQNNANHVHAVWRDFHGDFGRDLLKEHYAQHQH
jgi:hypothetical protein